MVHKSYSTSKTNRDYLDPTLTEDDTFLNGNPFIKSPRIFDRKLQPRYNNAVNFYKIFKDKNNWSGRNNG